MKKPVQLWEEELGRASYKDRDIASAKRRQRKDGRGEEAWLERRRWKEAGTLLRTFCGGGGWGGGGRLLAVWSLCTNSGDLETLPLPYPSAAPRQTPREPHNK